MSRSLGDEFGNQLGKKATHLTHCHPHRAHSQRCAIADRYATRAKGSVLGRRIQSGGSRADWMASGSGFWRWQGASASASDAGKRLSFSELVKRYSGDIPVRAMLDELLRVGSGEATQRRANSGLVVRGYIPQKGLDQKMAILGQDTADLITTIDHNVYVNPSSPRIQRKVMYDGLLNRLRHSGQLLRRVLKKC